MSDRLQTPAVLVSQDQLQPIVTLYENGQYLSAYTQASAVGPLHCWRGTEARIFAGRMAGNLGSQRLADWHFIHAWRGDRKHPEALWYFTRYRLAAHGPLAAWNFTKAHEFPQKTASKELQSHWLSQLAAILGRLRDFDTAEQWLRKAEAMGEEAWTCLEWAALYSLEDRHDDAEAAARRALVLRPWYRPAVQWVAYFLVQRQRDDEALDLLTQATQHLESSAVWAQLAFLQIELKHYDDARRSLDESERLSPLLDDRMKQWHEARRCDIACFQGDLAGAVAHANNAISAIPGNFKMPRIGARWKFYEALAQRLAHPNGSAKRVELDVKFVRQHHQTCAPATLTSIAKYWSMPAEHVEVAEEITYAGTPGDRERKWAQDHGWYSKAFTVTWQTAVALIDRGIPFTFTTTEVSSAHLQAVIGYDSQRGTLIIRDPGDRHQVEMAFDAMVERYRATGPRGMALVPIAEKDRLASLPLPDEALYDHMHQLDCALKVHQRELAQRQVQEMARQHPKHYLTLMAKRSLAFYDADLPAELKFTEKLLELFPGDLHLELSRAFLLSVMGRYHQRLEILKSLAEKTESDPAVWQQYAAELSADARQHCQALYFLRRAIRFNPMLARSYSTLALIRATQRQFAESLQLYHFAACLEDKDEFVAQDYFFEARAQGKTDEAMAFLQERFERLGAKSSQPTRTLYFAHIQQGSCSEALEVLERATRLRPTDGDLLTYSAESHMHMGDFAKAREILEHANGISKPASRLRSLALLAANQGDPVLAREHWAEVLKVEPIAEDAHRNYCLLLAEKEGRGAAVRHLQEVCNRFPHHFNLNRLLFDWHLEDGPVVREQALRKLIDIHPADAWTRREIALNLADQDRYDEGFSQLDTAESLEPDGFAVWHVRGLLYKRKHRTDDAKHAFREAIRKWVDFEPAIQELCWQTEHLQERRDAVAFVASEIVRQTSFGGAILTLTTTVQPNFPPDELLTILRKLRDARSDLWHGWSAVTRQSGYCVHTDEYLANAMLAVERFPSHSGLWLDLAEAQRVHKNTQGEMRSLQRALELMPSSIDGVRMLAEAHERNGRTDDAMKVFEAAIRRAPMLSGMYQQYAELLYRIGERDQAIERAKHALKLDPWFENAWNRLCNWLGQLDRMSEAVEMARAWTKNRPGDYRSWTRLAQAIQWQTPQSSRTDETKRIDESASAYDEAIRRNPFARDLYDLKAEMLGFAERFDEARKACAPNVFKSKMPLELRGRGAWVKALQGEYDQAKQLMTPILREDSAYNWGWTQLVDWSTATHDFKAYHDAANDMVRSRPQSAYALAYRGEARIRMEERDTGLEDLRAAHRKDPCYQLSAYLLFDEQVTDDNLAGAEATLQSMQQSISPALVVGRLIQFHAKRGNESIALERFKKECVSNFPQTQQLDLAMNALDKAGWKEQAEKILKVAMQEPHWHPHLAMLYAARWNPNLANDLPDRISAIDKALEKNVETFRFLDLKAELLASGNQFEHAWKTCQMKALPIDQFALDGRGAWVMYRSGRTEDAIAAMRELVQKNPKYIWGWGQLADWYGRKQAWGDVLEAAEQLVLVAPRDPTGYGYRGQAKQNLGDPDAARADYLHALDLQPSYMFAAWQLFDMYARKAEWRRADKILDKAKKHADPGEWALRKVDMCVYENRKASFPAEFENLCRNAAKAPYLLDMSLQFLVQAGWWSDAEEILRGCLDLGAHICDPWVRLRVAMGDRTVGGDIQDMSERRPERTNCVTAYAIELAYAKDSSGLRQWIRSNDECLRAETSCWAKVGLALSIVADWNGVIEWMSDYANHGKATPGMLMPMVRAHRSLGETEDARKVSLHALTKLNPDYASSYHKVWLMYDQTLSGDVIPVQRYLETSDLGGFDPYHQMIAALVRAVWLTATDKATGFSHGRKLLVDTAAHTAPTMRDPALTKAYQRGVAEMARLRGTFGSKVWRIWRWLMPTLPPVPPNA